MTSFTRTVVSLAFFPVMLSSTPSSAEEVCLKKQTLTENVQTKAKLKGEGDPRFRVEKDETGQSIVYWDHGEKTKTFFAVTFRANGCAIQLSSGLTRRFIFPKTRFNSGVFYEMDKLSFASLKQE